MSSIKAAEGSLTGEFSFKLPRPLQKAFEGAARQWESDQKTRRLWERDATLWTGNDESRCLGWLDIVDQQLTGLSKFQALTAEVQEDGFTHLLVLGMGGASLAAEVFGLTFDRQAGSPELLVLDSTDPAQIRSFREKLDPARTLFCVSSKSGGTLEPNILLQYFFEETRGAVGERAGHHFIAITDPGSKLEGLAEKLGFRRLYHGVASIPGRYSALSDFGLVPHAAAGLDTEKLLGRAQLMVSACRNETVSANPGVTLGLILGTAANTLRRDKVTLICSSSIYALGGWLEQLLAGSTAKQERGLIPVNREPLTQIENYGPDRIFVYIKFFSDSDDALEDHVSALEASGAPVLRIGISDLYDIGQVFFEWQVAAAVAASVIGVNAFDHPDVDKNKAATQRLMSEFETTGSLPPLKPFLEQGEIQLFADPAGPLGGATTLGGAIRCQLDQIQPGDYFALLAYLPMFPPYEERLQEIRKYILESKQVATVLGFGPRFLHSTAQAYKGGPNSGLFLQITCDAEPDLAIPGQTYTFGMVKSAQARGDFETLAEGHRRTLRIHLGPDLDKDLDHLRDIVAAAVSY